MSEKLNEEEVLAQCCGDGPNPETFNEIFELVYKINKRIEKMQRETVQESNLTPAQYLILRQLWDQDGKQFKELAENCSCSRSTITGVVDTMENNELVKRVPNPKDRRSQLVKLTKKGKELEELTPQMDGLVNNCCQGLDEFDIKLLGGLLKKLYDSLNF
jgi:DNA-binding MarR family transcriptional regulator